MTHYNRLPLTHAFNVRDLGGYSAGDGLITRWRAFIRADDTGDLTADETDFLVEYGVRTVVDLRSLGEADARPNPFREVAEVDYHLLPLGPNQIEDVEVLARAATSSTLGDFYVALLAEYPTRIAAVMHTIADAREGAILFHCAAGKDRTGVMAALLLALAGVGESDIITNYSASYEHLMQNPAVRAYAGSIPSVLMESSPSSIHAALDWIAREHRSAAQYLDSIGVHEAERSRIIDRLCEPARTRAR